MFEKLRDRLCDEAAQWYKMWSSWLAALWGLVVTVFWTDPTLLPSLLNSMPGEVRVFISPIVFGAAAALPILVRLIKQPKIEQPK